MQIEEKYICFLIKDYELLEKYNEIWEQRLKIVSKKDLIVNTNFHNNKIPKEGSIFICWSVILIVSVFTTEKNNYLLEFLEECTYIIKEKKIPAYLTDKISFDSDREDCDEENSHEEK